MPVMRKPVPWRDVIICRYQITSNSPKKSQLVKRQLLFHIDCDARPVVNTHFTRKQRTSDTWWRHQMEPFSALLAICAGNSPVSGEFPAQRPVTRSFDVFFDLHPNKRLSKQWRGWYLRRHRVHYDVIVMFFNIVTLFTGIEIPIAQMSRQQGRLIFITCILVKGHHYNHLLFDVGYIKCSALIMLQLRILWLVYVLFLTRRITSHDFGI